MTTADEAQEELSLPPLEADVAVSLANRVQAKLHEACKASPGRPASQRTKTLVARRVPLSWLPSCETMEIYGYIVWDEALTVLDRVLAYPFTAQYRKHLRNSPSQMLAAWQFHSLSLRVGELYIVQDRTKALLEFLNAVGEDCGLRVAACHKSFESRFKKTFDRRLRERHRLTHAHERPSMVSRLIDMSGTKWSEDKGEVAATLNYVLDKTLPLLSELSKKLDRPSPETLEDIEALYEAGAKREARQMLKLVGDSLLETLGEGRVAGDRIV